MAKQRTSEAPPWKRKTPKKPAGATSRKLTAAQRGEARARARKAGRPYPNLVDNMAVARKKSEGGEPRRKTTRKTKRAHGR